MCRNTVCRAPMSTPWVGSSSRTSRGERRKPFGQQHFLLIAPAEVGHQQTWIWRANVELFAQRGGGPNQFGSIQQPTSKTDADDRNRHVVGDGKRADGACAGPIGGDQNYAPVDRGA